MDLTPQAAGAAAMPDEPRVRAVPATRPLAWLRLGARDLARCPLPGLALGALVAALGFLLAVAARHVTYLAPALLGGFLLVAPFVAVPLYALSRQLERGEAPDAARAWRAARGNAGSLALFGLVLTLAYIFWERFSAILFAFFYRGEPLHLSRLPAELLGGPYGALLLTFVVAGAALAAVVYGVGVVTAPLLVDRPLDAVTAMLTSVRCCLRNPLTALEWAALIAALTAVGFATLMVGIVVVFPWLAHASWHAYRELVE